VCRPARESSSRDSALVDRRRDKSVGAYCFLRINLWVAACSGVVTPRATGQNIIGCELRREYLHALWQGQHENTNGWLSRRARRSSRSSNGEILYIGMHNFKSNLLIFWGARRRLLSTNTKHVWLQFAKFRGFLLKVPTIQSIIIFNTDSQTSNKFLSREIILFLTHTEFFCEQDYFHKLHCCRRKNKCKWQGMWINHFRQDV